jgi:hypothetical protein
MRSLAVLLSILALVLAACADDEEEPGADGESPTASWEGPGPPAGDGELDVAAFNDFLDQNSPDYQRSPMRLALEFAALEDPRAARSALVMSSSVEAPDAARVRLTEDGIADDSIRATRYELELSRDDAGAWRLDAAAFSQRCQRGRGHQDFSPEPCV